MNIDAAAFLLFSHITFYPKQIANEVQVIYHKSQQHFKYKIPSFLCKLEKYKYGPMKFVLFFPKFHVFLLEFLICKTFTKFQQQMAIIFQYFFN